MTDFQNFAGNESKLIDEDINRRLNLENSLCHLVHNLRLSSQPPKNVKFKMRKDT